MSEINAESTKRFIWIDYAKAIGIFLVVFGHTAIPGYLYNAIFSFHMPLFFFISGYLFSFKKYGSYKYFLSKKIKQIVIPYFYFNIITYIFWFFIGRKFGNDSTRVIPFYKPLIGIMYGNGIGDFLVHNIASWFLACLFVVENLFFLFFRSVAKNNKLFLMIISVFLGFIDYTYDPVRWPWSFNVALIALVFYASGNLARKKIDIFLQTRVIFLILIMLLIFPVYLFFSAINSGVNLNLNYYHNYWYFWLGAFSGILIVVVISRLLELYLGKTSFIEYISKNTIIILIFQFIAMSVVKAFTLYILKMPLTTFDNKVLVNILVSLIVIIMLVPLMFIIDNHLPFLVGKPLKSSFGKGLRIINNEGTV